MRHFYSFFLPFFSFLLGLFVMVQRVWEAKTAFLFSFFDSEFCRWRDLILGGPGDSIYSFLCVFFFLTRETFGEVVIFRARGRSFLLLY